jgi:BirA family biotin operon repressor/biotin-[acetyl-CoA-carboxylase] ligase
MRRLADKERTVWDMLRFQGLGVGPVFWYDTVPSTMDVAFRVGGRNPLHFTLVVSDMQTRGRGSHGRCWCSSAGDLHLSVLLTEFDFKIPYSMVTSYAVYRTLRGYTQRVRLKWVNDVLWENGKKIAGVLTEEKAGRTVIGIGVNVNSSFPVRAMRDRATSFFRETGHRIPLTTLLVSVVSELKSLLNAVHGGGLEKVLAQWEADSCIVGRSVLVENGKRTYQGIVTEIEKSSGALVLECGGERRIFYDGRCTSIQQ